MISSSADGIDVQQSKDIVINATMRSSEIAIDGNVIRFFVDYWLRCQRPAHPLHRCRGG